MRRDNFYQACWKKKVCTAYSHSLKSFSFLFCKKKNAIHNIVDPLVTVTYDCLRDGIFPDVLKIAKTVSVPKKWSFT